MTRPTDDPPRTELPIETASESALVRAAAVAPKLEARDEDDRLTRESFRAILSSQQREGRWEPADEIEVRAICGEVKLDFTRAELPPGNVVEIEARAICGTIEIVVPDGAEVDIDGTPVLGSIEHHVRRKRTGERIREWVTGERDDERPARAPGSEPPYFHVDARAILGTVKVTGR